MEAQVTRTARFGPVNNNSARDMAISGDSRTRPVEPFASSCSLAKPVPAVFLRTAPATPPVAALVTEINLL